MGIGHGSLLAGNRKFEQVTAAIRTGAIFLGLSIIVYLPTAIW
jgi:hypothetical protein